MQRTIALLISSVLIVLLVIFLYAQKAPLSSKTSPTIVTPVTTEVPPQNDRSSEDGIGKNSNTSLHDLYTSLLARFDSFSSSLTNTPATTPVPSDTLTLTPTPIPDITMFPYRSHSSLTNLTNSDDHTQYIYGSGRSGGQTLVGGTNANDILTLQSSSATTGTSSTEKALKINVGSGGEIEALTILNNGSIGFQKTNPGFTLDVGGIVNATAFYVNGAPYVGSQWSTAGSSVYYTTGNVGIGTSSPASTLDIAGTLKTTGLIFPTGAVAGYVLTTDANGVASWNAPTSSGGDWTLTGDNLYPNNLTNNLAIGATDAGSAKLYVNGNVGIGTTNPSGLLDVNGMGIFRNNTYILPAGVNGVYLGNGEMLTSDESGLYDAGGDVPLAVYTSDQQLARYGTGGILSIDNSGNVGIGTTSPSSPLDVNGITWLRGTTGGTTGLYVSSSGDVGVGTTNPTANLEVKGSGNASYTMKVVGKSGAPGQGIHLESGNGSWGFYDPGGAGGDIVLKAGYGGDSEYSSAGKGGSIFINPGVGYGNGNIILANQTGNVGIGTTSPTGKLTISSSQASSLIPFLQFVPTGTAGINTVSYFGGASNKAGELMAIGDYDSSAAPYHLYYSESNGANPALVDAWQTSKSSVTQTNADIFFTRGSVGISTTAPTQALHVVGSARITGALYDSSNSAGSSTNILTSTGTGTAWSSLSSALDTTYFKQNGNSFTALAVLGTNDAYGLAFETSNTERLRIDASGNVGIGTTAPGDALDVVGNIDTTTYYKLGNSKVLSQPNSSSLVIGTGAGGTLTNNYNTIVGVNAAYSAGNATRNTIMGNEAAYNLTTSGYNTIVGYNAGWSLSTSGSGYNTLIGDNAGFNLTGGGTDVTNGTENTFIGYRAGYGATGGDGNIYIGWQAGNGDGNTGVEDYNILVGYDSWLNDGVTHSIGLGAGVGLTGSGLFIVGDSSNGASWDYRINDSYWGGGVVASGGNGGVGLDFSFNATGGSGTDKAGGSLIIAGGKATGNADGGDIIFKGSIVGSSGSTLQTLAERMRLTDEGNLGIGTTAPTQALHVVGSARITGALYDSSNSAGSSTNILTSTGTGTAWSSLSSALDTSYFKQNGNSFTALAVLGTNDAYGLAFETSNTERLRIDASGNVGIGTTSPLAKLEVKDSSSLTQQSAEMIINLDDRSFGSDLGHWSGTNWTIGSSVSTHTAGANAYTLSNTYLTSAPVASNVYVVSVTVNTTTTGTLTIAFGGSTVATVGQTTGTTYPRYFVTAANTNPLTITPNATWEGTIDWVTIKQVTSTASVALQLTPSDGTTYPIEFRTGPSGSTAVSIGYQAGQYADSYNNADSVGIGYQALQYAQDGSNVAVGSYALRAGTNIGLNAAVGTQALVNLNYGYNNNVMGYYSLSNVREGQNNVALGSSIGSNASGATYNFNDNVLLGYRSAFNLGSGSQQNVLIGTESGYNLTSATGNVFLGYQSGYSETGSNKLYIDNSSTTSPLIWGDFSTNVVNFNGSVGIGTTAPGYTLDVKSTGTDIARFIGSNSTGCTLSDGGIIACSSDRNLKKNILDTNLGLDAVMALRPVEFNWNSQVNGDKKYLGFIAQDVETLAPNLVTTDSNGYKQLNSIGLIPIVAKAIQEQQGLINTLQTNVQIPDFKIATVSSKLETLNTKVSSWDGLFITIQSVIQSIQDAIVALRDQFGLVQSDITSTKSEVASLSASLTSLNSWKEAIASGSGVLGASDSALLDHVATVSALTVQNQTTTFDLTVLNKLTTGVIELGAGIDGDEINASTGIRFQTLSQGPIDFMNGKVIIDVDGNLKAVKVSADRYAASKAQGTVGLGLLKAGDTSVTIETPSVNANSRIFVTALTKTNKPLYVSAIIEGSHFVVSLGETPLTNVRFNWWIVEEE